MNFAEVLEAWLADVRRTRHAETHRTYSIAAAHVRRWRPDLAQRALTRLDLIQYRDHRAAAVAVTTVNKELRALRTCLLWAELNELEHPKVQLRRLMLPLPPDPEKSLNPAEWLRVLDSSALDLPAQVVLRICHATGLRLGETLNLRWSDVDLELGTLQVVAKLDWRPKSKEALRTVTAPGLCAWLADYRATLLRRGPQDLVCQRDRVRGRGWNYPKSTRIFARLRAIYDRAGVSGRKSTHALRHGLAIDLVSAGAPIHAVQKHLGHSSPHLTLQVYARARRSDVDAAGLLLEQYRAAAAGTKGDRAGGARRAAS